MYYYVHTFARDVVCSRRWVTGNRTHPPGRVSLHGSSADLSLNLVFKQHRPDPVFIGGLLETWRPVNRTVSPAEAGASGLPVTSNQCWSLICDAAVALLQFFFHSFLSVTYLRLEESGEVYRRKCWRLLEFSPFHTHIHIFHKMYWPCYLKGRYILNCYY